MAMRYRRLEPCRADICDGDIGDVRGYGLFFGAEFVRDRETKEPATDYVTALANAMRHRGVLLNKLGIHYNTLKVRPPLPFSRENADLMLETLDDALSALGPVEDFVAGDGAA